MAHTEESPNKAVRHLRQILLWPLQLVPIRPGSQIQSHWEILDSPRADNPWRELADEFTGDPAQFQVRHYNEFVTFLPYVQQFLYGEGRARPSGEETEDAPEAPPMRVFRRHDIATVRVTPRAGEPPRVLHIAHVDLYFFFDIDIVLLNVEVYADDLTLFEVEDTLYRFGRAYPVGWDAQGQGLHCMHRVEWLAADGRILASSDFAEREKYLAFVCKHRSPRIGAHWAFLLQPLVPDHSEAAADPRAIRYRQIEYFRMPVMAYVAIDDPHSLSRSDFVRLGLVTAPGGDEALPFSDRHVADFERQVCYDRFWSERADGDSAAVHSTRYMCCGHALVVVGDARSAYFTDAEVGVLAQFRHQHFLIFLIAHFQKAALQMFSDRLVFALKRLDVGHAESVKRFKRAIRQSFEIFLRFTHRYWFHEIADQAQTKALFSLCARHLGLDPLYAEVRERIGEMNAYLDTDSLRRQANTVVRLTVVTILGLIGTILTGFFGMNLFAFGEGDLSYRLLYLAACLMVVTAMTGFAVVKSKRLADLLDVLSDERLSTRAKLGALVGSLRPGAGRAGREGG